MVREKETHIEVIESISDTVLKLGMFIKGLTYSPIKGPEGNIEYLLYSSKKPLIFDRAEFDKQIKEVVMDAHDKVQ